MALLLPALRAFGVALPPALLTAAAADATRNLEGVAPAALVDLLAVYAALRHHPGEALLHNVALRVSQVRRLHYSAHRSWISWHAHATIFHVCVQALAATPDAEGPASSFSGSQATVLLSAYGTLGYVPSLEVLQQLQVQHSRAGCLWD